MENEDVHNRLDKKEIRDYIGKLLESNNWQVFDISELVPCHDESYYPFIGTEEEFETFKYENYDNA